MKGGERKFAAGASLTVLRYTSRLWIEWTLARVATVAIDLTRKQA
jgi:hypothetical protein